MLLKQLREHVQAQDNVVNTRQAVLRRLGLGLDGSNDAMGDDEDSSDDGDAPSFDMDTRPRAPLVSA